MSTEQSQIDNLKKKIIGLENEAEDFEKNNKEYVDTLKFLKKV